MRRAMHGEFNATPRAPALQVFSSKQAIFDA
jgi:hypothetical protein